MTQTLYVHINKRTNKQTTTKKTNPDGCQWLTPVILATWEAEIGRIVV
jgi:hypothetical protein